MKVLVIDDDKRIRDLFKIHLEFEYNLFCDEETNGEDGIEAIRSKDYDLVICDHHMPPKSGIDVLKYVSSLETKPVMVMLTACNEKELYMESINANVFRFIEKIQFDGDKLSELIKEYFEEVKRKNKDHALKNLGESTSMLMHEVNNPLSVISLRTEILKRQTEDGAEVNLEKMHKGLDSIVGSCQKISSIIEDQRFRLQNNKLNTEDKIHFPLKRIYIELKDYIELKEFDSEVIFNIDCFNSDQEIYFNPNKLYQIVVNLVNNSYDAISDLDEKWIVFSIRNIKEDDRIEINCIDSGGGIPSNIQNRLFSKLYTKKKKLKGQGLGLAICKEIMNSYNGDLVFNDSLDNTCFSLKIPNTK